MKYGRVITAAVCAAVLLAALCGCGDTPPEVSDPATTASTTTTTTAEETTTTTDETTADTTTATAPKSTTKKPTTATTTKKPTTTTTKPTTTTLPTSNIINKIVSPVSVGYTPYEGVSGKSIPYKEVKDLAFQIVPESWGEAGIVRSMKQLETQTGGKEGSLSPLLEKYDEAFFRDQALVVISYNQTVPIRYGDDFVYQLKVNGRTLCIEIGERHPPSVNIKEWSAKMYQNNLVLEVDQDDIARVEDVELLILVYYPE